MYGWHLRGYELILSEEREDFFKNYKINLKVGLMVEALIGAIGAIIVVLFALILRGQGTIKDDAKEGRAVLHLKLEQFEKDVKEVNKEFVEEFKDHSKRLNTIETLHNQNHPNQLKNGVS